MKETIIIQSGSFVGNGSVDHEGDHHHPEREIFRRKVVTMKKTNIIQSGSLVRWEVLTMKETIIIQSGSLVEGGVLNMKETNIIQSGSLVWVGEEGGRGEGVDHERD